MSRDNQNPLQNFKKSLTDEFSKKEKFIRVIKL